jgi:hypothetical protein
VLHDDLSARKTINAERLVGPRNAWILCYREMLTIPELTKLVILLRDLAKIYDPAAFVTDFLRAKQPRTEKNQDQLKKD